MVSVGLTVWEKLTLGSPNTTFPLTAKAVTLVDDLCAKLVMVTVTPATSSVEVVL